MTKVKVSDRQSIADVAMQNAGSHEAIFAIARNNGVTLDAEIADSELDVTVSDEKVTGYYSNNDYKPATFQCVDNDFITNDDGSENIMYNEENIEV